MQIDPPSFVALYYHELDSLEDLIKERRKVCRKLTRLEKEISEPNKDVFILDYDPISEYEWEFEYLNEISKLIIRKMKDEKWAQ